MLSLTWPNHAMKCQDWLGVASLAQGMPGLDALDMAKPDGAKPNHAEPGHERAGHTSSGKAWPNLVRLCHACTGQATAFLGWLSQAWSEWAMPGMARPANVRTGHARSDMANHHGDFNMTLISFSYDSGVIRGWSSEKCTPNKVVRALLQSMWTKTTEHCYRACTCEH